jgi:hypothetical protein
MEFDWNDINGIAPGIANARGAGLQPPDHDTWTQRVSRRLFLEFDDFPQVLADTPSDLTQQLILYVYSLKGDTLRLDYAFQEYKRTHSDDDQQLLATMLQENKRLETENHRLLRSNQILMDGSSLCSQEVEGLRQTVVELQDRLDRANIRGQ